MKNYTAQFREEALKISDEIGLQKACEKLTHSLWNSFLFGEKLVVGKDLQWKLQKKTLLYWKKKNVN